MTHALRKPEFSHRRDKNAVSVTGFLLPSAGVSKRHPSENASLTPENLFFSLTDPFSAAESAQADQKNSDPSP